MQRTRTRDVLAWCCSLYGAAAIAAASTATAARIAHPVLLPSNCKKTGIAQHDSGVAGAEGRAVHSSLRLARILPKCAAQLHTGDEEWLIFWIQPP